MLICLEFFVCGQFCLYASVGLDSLVYDPCEHKSDSSKSVSYKLCCGFLFHA